METDNYLQVIRSAPENMPAIPPGMMPRTREQSLIILKNLPKQYYEALRPHSVDDALRSITPSLSVFRKEYGEQSLQAILVIILNDVVKFFNIGKTMGQDQMVQTIGLIIEDFYYFNIEDFKLCFNNAKRGRYGKVYDRIDGNVIYEWLQKYWEERILAVYPEGSCRSYIADRNERFTGKSDEEFEKFRISYIAEKSLRK